HLAAHQRESAPPIPRSNESGVSKSRGPILLRADAKPAPGDLDPLLCLARNRSADLFPLRRRSQQIAQWRRHRNNGRSAAALDQNLDRPAPDTRSSACLIGKHGVAAISPILSWSRSKQLKSRDANVCRGTFPSLRRNRICFLRYENRGLRSP